MSKYKLPTQKADQFVESATAEAFKPETPIAKKGKRKSRDYVDAKKTGLVLPYDLHAWLKAKAAYSRKDFNELIVEVLATYKDKNQDTKLK